MAVTDLTLKAQALSTGIKYTYTIDNLNEIANVPVNKYFYDYNTKLIYYKDPNGDILKIFETPSSLARTVEIQNPQAGDERTIMYTHVNSECKEVVAVLVGANNNNAYVTYEVRFGTDRSQSGADSFVNPTQVSSETGGDIATLSSTTTCFANRWVWLKITSVTNTPTSFILDLRYIESV